MTAFLSVETVWAHIVPATPREARPRLEAAGAVVSARRRIMPDGRLTCRWRTVDNEPEFPPD
jgi:hypothetical protein